MSRIGRSICLLCVLLTMNLAYGQPDFPELLPHNGVSVKWSPQGDIYATGRVDGTVSIYDSTVLLQSIPNGHISPSYGASSSPDGSRLATGTKW
jgi:WD40 repeat protein